ncbi:hypothetical protein FRC11_013719 [Ceratobasidium sp. 423]|nr:hypothetical protein FRC11_013719 [Ceratobasidium sp. 423]
MNQTPPQPDTSSPMGQWVYTSQRKRVTSSVPCRVGKSFGRVLHQTYPFGNILDKLKTYLALSKADVQDIPEFSQKIYHTFYPYLRRKIGSDLDAKLLNDTPDWDFRNSLSQALQQGRSQACTDDIAVLKAVCPHWPGFSHLPLNHTRGWATSAYAQALRTPDLDLEDSEVKHGLIQDLTDAPSHQYYAGLFPDNKFPADGEHPLEGFCRSQLFTNLRFTLHQAPSWYNIELPLDSRFNYFRFYSEILALLEEDEFKPEVDALIVYLNKIVFPHVHILPQDGPNASSPSTREKVLVAVHARCTRG